MAFGVQECFDICFFLKGPTNPELLKQASTLADVELKHGKLVKIT